MVRVPGDIDAPPAEASGSLTLSVLEGRGPIFDPGCYLPVASVDVESPAWPLPFELGLPPGEFVVLAYMPTGNSLAAFGYEAFEIGRDESIVVDGEPSDRLHIEFSDTGSLVCID